MLLFIKIYPVTKVENLQKVRMHLKIRIQQILYLYKKVVTGNLGDKNKIFHCNSNFNKT